MVPPKSFAGAEKGRRRLVIKISLVHHVVPFRRLIPGGFVHQRIARHQSAHSLNVQPEPVPVLLAALFDRCRDQPSCLIAGVAPLAGSSLQFARAARFNPTPSNCHRRSPRGKTHAADFRLSGSPRRAPIAIPVRAEGSTARKGGKRSRGERDEGTRERPYISFRAREDVPIDSRKLRNSCRNN